MSSSDTDQKNDIDAKQANRLSIEGEFKYLLGRIQTMTTVGNFSIDTDDIHDDNVARLRKRGFKVQEVQNTEVSAVYRISWDNI